MKPELKKHLKLFLPLGLFAVLFGLAFIQLLPVESNDSTESAAVMDDFAAMKTIAVLGFVFLLLGLFAWLAKKYVAPMTGLRSNGHTMKILENLPVSQKSRLVLVNIAGEKLVLGVTEHTITVLTELENMDGKDDNKNSFLCPPDKNYSQSLKKFFQNDIAAQTEQH